MTGVERTTGAARRCDALGAEISETRVLVRGGREVQLWSRESVLVAVLLERFPGPVRESEFSSVLWPGAVPSESARGRSMVRLRRRLAVVGLALRCRARVGYTLEESPWALELAAGSDRPAASTLPRQEPASCG